MFHDSLCVYIGLWMHQGSLESTKNGAKTKDGKLEIIFLQNSTYLAKMNE